MQDNDPIRRGCIGGTVKVAGHVGEDVCNIDGSLGLVIPLVDTDFVATLADPAHSGSSLHQYPLVAQKCSGAFINGAPPNIFSCGPSNNFHPGECPNGDAPSGGACLLPIASGFGQCNASNSTVTASFVRSAAGAADGRAYNLFMTSGTLSDGAVTFIQQPIPALGAGVGVDMAGGFNRIHSIDVASRGRDALSQMVDMTDQIGCLGQADPCSIGYAGDGGKSWNAPRGSAGAAPRPPAASGIDAVNVFAVYPQVSDRSAPRRGQRVPALAQAVLRLSRRLLDGHERRAHARQVRRPARPRAFEEHPDQQRLLRARHSVRRGHRRRRCLNTTFCEDFDEQVVCNPTATTASTLPANVNGCATNPSGIPTAHTICGNGTRESYEECDDGTNNGITGDKCSQTCRCTTFLDPATGNCH